MEHYMLRIACVVAEYLDGYINANEMDTQIAVIFTTCNLCTIENGDCYEESSQCC
jgi:hypothetical protein